MLKGVLALNCCTEPLDIYWFIRSSLFLHPLKGFYVPSPLNGSTEGKFYGLGIEVVCTFCGYFEGVGPALLQNIL